MLPSWTVTYVAQVPGGAHPSYALGYSVRDNDYYLAWDAIGRDRDAFTRWLDEQVYGQAGRGDLEGKGGPGGWVPPGEMGRPPGETPSRHSSSQRLKARRSRPMASQAT